MKKKQLDAMQRIIARSTRAEFNKIRPVTLCGNRSGWIALDGFCAVVTPEKPEGVGIIGDASEKVQNMAAQKIADRWFDNSQFGNENIPLPTVKQLAAYIKISGGGRKPQNLRPYPLNGGEVWVNPVYLRDVLEAMGGSARAYHNGKLSSPVMLWADGGYMGLVMPRRPVDDEGVKKELLERAEEAKRGAESPARKKPYNQGQPTNFREMKKVILAGVVIEMVKPNGATITANSLFNGSPTIDISTPGVSKHWEFEGGYCVHYWDAAGVCRAADDWDYKIRVLGPMEPQTEEEKAAEAAEFNRQLEAHKAALAEQRVKDAAEEQARRETEERAHAENLAADAEKIKKAIQAFKTGGHVESCIVTATDASGEEREENIFVHLGRLYGVSLPVRSKGFIVSKLRYVEPNPGGQSMRYSAQVTRKLPDGVKTFLFALMQAIGEECPEDLASDEEITHLFGGDTATEQQGTSAPGAESAYKYGMRLRGCAPGCQPAGFVDRLDDPAGVYRDILVYIQPLTTEQLEAYEMDDLNKALPQTAQNAPTTRENGETIKDTPQSENGAYVPETSVLQRYAASCTRTDCEQCNVAHCENRIADSEAGTSAPELDARPHTAHAMAEHGELGSAAYASKIRAKRRELNYYARMAYITPENAAHIAEKIDALQAEIKQLQALKTGAGSASPKAIRQAGKLRQIAGANTS